MDETHTALTRRYALVNLAQGIPGGEGKYLMYSNDAHHAYVIARYNETGDLSVEQNDGTLRTITGTFWRLFWVRPDSGLLTHEAAPGNSPITGFDPEAIVNAALEHTSALVEIETLLRTRNAAIGIALHRYTARAHRHTGTPDEPTRWGVYDRVTASWPATKAGRRIHDNTTDRAEAKADAHWLNTHHA